ncbi:MAG: hypothetical protein UW46_C0003G0003 [Candidatus Yanofskybacteria bacterium GW2011_GWF1_44_227]|uniref:Uncharacterized protein n=1 Tax=Candidatus Yanofskybacteria bacterium GW2011_GWE2_40_11 TaxID=1619033 RepID=A0A0G0TTI6_9BACT|nr:MAG: hypothetical protein UT69_C0039G0007 [Candidatus Yanofskybacteria bacterium GW2011_GWE1_40_10]KKR41192.1 MAG: hypothetical protein UT75_C0001G0096 [Candidatus Yanofskybacteria bacterium GW2011_GWE2_40_11]KKT15730.1 MAG: hypothetical protein UV97_C0003G0062 [Candidatus Yanofskybacteria bacterium GW2011_GWF2_43_596]KKT53382.1 MAG: hypothetical protein UW46_C0003G0003 [Candidatus Yanofskybacteria bacterium GW2011_GWF1_44_227]OGN36205.1 MAG: hypothetical protein A2241_00455 [Candidatus Yano
MDELTPSQEIIKNDLIAHFKEDATSSLNQVVNFLGQKQTWYCINFDHRYLNFAKQDMIMVLKYLIAQSILEISDWRTSPDMNATFGFVLEPVFSLSETFQAQA